MLLPIGLLPRLLLLLKGFTFRISACRLKLVSFSERHFLLVRFLPVRFEFHWVELCQKSIGQFARIVYVVEERTWIISYT